MNSFKSSNNPNIKLLSNLQWKAMENDEMFRLVGQIHYVPTYTGWHTVHIPVSYAVYPGDRFALLFPAGFVIEGGTYPSTFIGEQIPEMNLISRSALTALYILIVTW